MRGTVSAAPGELAEERLYCVEDEATGLGVCSAGRIECGRMSKGDELALVTRRAR